MGRAVFVAALWVAGSLHAAPADDEVQREIARAHFQTGRVYYQAGRYSDAAREFEEAFRFFGRSEILYDVAKSYEQAGDLLNAVDAYRRYVALALTSEEEATARQSLNALEARLAHLVIKAAPPGTEVLVDGRALGATPLKGPIEIAPGHHVVALAKAGYETVTRPIDARPTEEIVLEADLRASLPPLVVAAPPRPPAYKRWWVWVSVSAAALVAAGAITGGVLGAQQSNGDEVSSFLPGVR